MGPSSEIPRKMAGYSKRPNHGYWRSSKRKVEVSLCIICSEYRVIIDKLEIGRTFVDRRTGRKSFNRIIPGLNIVVPWPKRTAEINETSKDQMNKDEDTTINYDTPDTLVGRRTFTRPTLAYPPLPAGLEFELHNRYSRFKRQKFARAIEQMAEWRRRNDPSVRESEELSKEIEKKDHNVYTPEQLRIRAANKLVKKARRTYLKRTKLTDNDVLLIASYIKRHIESKMATLIRLEKAVQPLTPLENRMTINERLAHRRKRAVLDRLAFLERKEQAEKEAEAKKLAVRENKGRYKVFTFAPSTKAPVRKLKKKKPLRR